MLQEFAWGINTRGMRLTGVYTGLSLLFTWWRRPDFAECQLVAIGFNNAATNAGDLDEIFW